MALDRYVYELGRTANILEAIYSDDGDDEMSPDRKKTLRGRLSAHRCAARALMSAVKNNTDLVESLQADIRRARARIMALQVDQAALIASARAWEEAVKRALEEP